MSQRTCREHTGHGLSHCVHTCAHDCTYSRARKSFRWDEGAGRRPFKAGEIWLAFIAGVWASFSKEKQAARQALSHSSAGSNGERRGQGGGRGGGPTHPPQATVPEVVL